MGIKPEFKTVAVHDKDSNGNEQLFGGAAPPIVKTNPKGQTVTVLPKYEEPSTRVSLGNGVIFEMPWEAYKEYGKNPTEFLSKLGVKGETETTAETPDGTESDESGLSGTDNSNGDNDSNDDTVPVITQASEAHDIYKDTQQQFTGGIDDFGKWLADIRDAIMKEAMANPLDSDWGKGILDYYGVLGDNSAKAVNAATAGENAGNIDSYAAANAERQRISKLGQGIESVMGMSTERFNNMIAGLESIGVNTERLFGAQGNLTDTARQYATDLYLTDADTTNEYSKLRYSSNGDVIYNLSDDGIKAHLMDAYKSHNTVNGNSDEIDWSATDKAIWDDVIELLQEDGIYSQLSPTYLYNLIAQIMKPTTEATATETEIKSEPQEKQETNKKRSGWDKFEDILAWILNPGRTGYEVGQKIWDEIFK